ncbi:MAG: hypothetical protein J3Q66DRAFT_355324 [Benniella sp.]|nr:MAG: hypothetical protein J3Q66DRAFT_355324 [Benniella sp.]
MDFFAQAYNSTHRSGGPSPVQSPRAEQPGVCQGYGTEVNDHLRRASSGLETDVPRLHQLSPSPPGPGHGHHHSHGRSHSYGYGYSSYASHRQQHQNHESTQPMSPTGNKVTIHACTHDGKDTGTGHQPTEGSHERDHPSETSPGMDHSNCNRNGQQGGRTSWFTRPAQHRRVSNPCLQHHTNSNGSGVVRSPVMPQHKHEQPLSPSGHAPTIAEGSEARV